ncbi:MAG: xanthine dehydrogenase family protein subunit M [Pseudomonadota bacterium]
MRYEAPDTLDRAVELLSGESGLTRVLAGGTDVLVQLRAGHVEPDLVVDIKRIDGMFAITEDAEGFRVGAAVSGAMLAEHPGVSRAWPGVVEALELVGSTQIQSRATMAGNLCNASPAADSVPAMIAAGAVARIHGPNGQRDIPVEEVGIAPGKTALAKGEVVGSILLPARPAHSGDAYQRFIPRTEMDIAVVGCGISVVLDGDTISAARVSLGAVAPTALLVEGAAAALIGSTGDEAAMDALAAACSAACNPIDDKRGTVHFRTKVAGVLARRTAAAAIARAKGEAA